MLMLCTFNLSCHPKIISSSQTSIFRAPRYTASFCTVNGGLTVPCKRIKEAGVSTYGLSWKFILYCFWKRRVRSISCFLPHQKILILAKVIAGQRSAFLCNPIAGTIFNGDYLKITIFQTSKSIFSYILWEIILKLSRYVVGLKIKIFVDQNFDLCL